MDDKQFEIEKARHDERIAFAEMEVAKASYDVSKKHYNRAKFILDTLLTEAKSTLKPSPFSAADFQKTSSLQHVQPLPPLNINDLGDMPGIKR